jgi:hypothetical protein
MGELRNCAVNIIPVGARFSTPVQTGPVAHPASYTTGTGSFPGVKRPVRRADHQPLLVSRSIKSRAIPLPPSRASGLLGVPLPFTVKIKGDGKGGEWSAARTEMTNTQFQSKIRKGRGL